MTKKATKDDAPALPMRRMKDLAEFGLDGGLARGAAGAVETVQDDRVVSLIESPEGETVRVTMTAERVEATSATPAAEAAGDAVSEGGAGHP